MASTTQNIGEGKLNVKRGRKKRTNQSDHNARLSVGGDLDKEIETSMDIDNAESTIAGQHSNAKNERLEQKDTLNETSILAQETDKQAVDNRKTVMSTKETEAVGSGTQSLGSVEIPIDVELAADFEDAVDDSLCDISKNTYFDVNADKSFDMSAAINISEAPERVTAILYDGVEKEGLGEFAETLPVGEFRDSVSGAEGNESEDAVEMELETSESSKIQDKTGRTISGVVEQTSDTECQEKSPRNSQSNKLEVPGVSKEAIEQGGQDDSMTGIKKMETSEASGQGTNNIEQTNNVKVKKRGRGRPPGPINAKNESKPKFSHKEICEEIIKLLPQAGESAFSKEAGTRIREILKRDNKLPCPREGCDKNYKNFIGFQYHVLRCGVNVSFKCEYCELIYTSIDGLKYHKKAAHSTQDKETPGVSGQEAQPSRSRYSQRQRTQPDRLVRHDKQPSGNQDELSHNDARVEGSDLESSSDETEKNAEIKSYSWKKYYEVVKDATIESGDLEQTTELTNMSEITEALKKKSRLKCPKMCGRSFVTARRFYIHIKDCSGKNAKHRCTLCGKILQSRCGIRVHIISKHRKKRHNSENGEESEYSEGEKISSKVKKPSSRESFKQDPMNFVEKTKAWYEAFHGETVFTCWRPSLKHWSKLPASEAEDYLPVRKMSPVFKIEPVLKENNSTPEQSTEYQLPLFSSAPISSVGDLCSITFNVGGSVWAMDWAPVPIDEEDCDQYLAIGCHRDPEKLHLLSECYKEKGLLQIWRIPKLRNEQCPTEQPEFCLGIVHDYGPLWDIRWCPSGAWDGQCTEESELRRLGLLALACADGRIRIFSVPFPCLLLKNFVDDSGKSPEEFVFRATPHAELSPGSLCRQYLEECGAAWALSWLPINGHTKVIASYTDGTVAIWHLKTENRILKATTPDGLTERIFPVSHFQAHNSVIRALAWCPSEPNYIATGGYDKCIKIWDIRHTSQPVGYFKAASYNITWPLHWPLLLYNADAENRIRGTRCFDYHLSSRSDKCIGHASFCYVPHNATAWDNDYSHWLNAVVSVDAAGVLAMNLLKSGFYQKKPKSKTPIFRAMVEPIVQCDDENISDQSVQNESTESNKEQKETYKIVFKDTHPMSVTKEEIDLMFNDSAYVSPDKPTHSALHKVRWNPNFNCYYWLATAGKFGLVRLCYVCKLK